MSSFSFFSKEKVLFFIFNLGTGVAAGCDVELETGRDADSGGAGSCGAGSCGAGCDDVGTDGRDNNERKRLISFNIFFISSS